MTPRRRSDLDPVRAFKLRANAHEAAVAEAQAGAERWGLSLDSPLGQELVGIEEAYLVIRLDQTRAEGWAAAEEAHQRALKAWRATASKAHARSVEEAAEEQRRRAQETRVLASIFLGVSVSQVQQHFECPECGRWAGVDEAASAWIAAIGSAGLGEARWRSLAGSPSRPLSDPPFCSAISA
jgi:hypothetical protein